MASPSMSNPEAEEGNIWKHKFEAIERKRKEAQAERNILQKQVAGLSVNLESAKDLIPTYLQKLKDLQSKVLTLEEELESLKTLDEETSSVNLENVAREAANTDGRSGPTKN